MECKICEEFYKRYEAEQLGPIKVIKDSALPPDTVVFLNYHKIHEEQEKKGKPFIEFVRPDENLNYIGVIFNLEPEP